MNEAAITVKKKFDISNFLLSYGFYILFVVMFIVCGIISPYFLTRDNLMQIMWVAATCLLYTSEQSGGTVYGINDDFVSDFVSSLTLSVTSGFFGVHPAKRKQNIRIIKNHICMR